VIRYVWLGRLVLLVICLIFVACLESEASATAKSLKEKVIPEDEAKLFLFAPGLANSEATFIRQEGAGETTEVGHWQSPFGALPEAWLSLKQLSHRQFSKGPPLLEHLRATFQSGARGLPGAIASFGDHGESANQLGALEFQRFTLDTGVACVGIQQYTRSRENVGTAESPLGDTMIFGWYCAKPEAPLSNDTALEFLRGIGVKGIALP
jgi:hypothetical protein